MMPEHTRADLFFEPLRFSERSGPGIDDDAESVAAVWQKMGGYFGKIIVLRAQRKRIESLSNALYIGHIRYGRTLLCYEWTDLGLRQLPGDWYEFS